MVRLFRQAARRLPQSSDRYAPQRSVAKHAAPLHTEWTWRPELTPHSADIQVFHDGPAGALTLLAPTDPAAADVTLKPKARIPGFASLAVCIPRQAQIGLSPRHILRLDAQVSSCAPLPAYARLNLKHGPDTSSQSVPMPHPANRMMAEFDMASTDVTRRPADHMWIDLIFERPGRTVLRIADLILSRRPRAEC